MFHRIRLGVVAAIVAVPTVAVAGVASASSSSSGSSATITARSLPSSDTGSAYAHRGAAVASSKLTVRTFVNGSDGFSLAGVGEAQYPASTTNGGRTWQIDGPHFHVNAANAPDVVTRVGAVGPSTYFAYGGGGQSVIVSTDAGKHWWRAYFSGSPLTVEPTSAGGGTSGLVTIVENNPGKFQAYVSTDGGRHWHLTHGFV